MIDFHTDGTEPPSGWIWVFGSNILGWHGAGAALVARERYGAVWNNGEGLQSKCYAIPTKSHPAYTLPVDRILRSVEAFKDCTIKYPDSKWWVTRVGCGLAGYKDEQIAPMFRGARNCSFAEEWRPWLT